MLGTRAILNGLIFVSILFLPWWLTLVFAVILVLAHKAYEVLLWALFFDSFYGTSLDIIWGMEYLATFIMLIILALSFALKRKVIFYQNI
jgi:hypothetical protein